MADKKVKTVNVCVCVFSPNGSVHFKAQSTIQTEETKFHLFQIDPFCLPFVFLFLFLYFFLGSFFNSYVFNTGGDRGSLLHNIN